MAASDIRHFTTEVRLSAQSSPASTILPLRIAYRTYGDPSRPAILLPTCYGGKIDDTTTWLYSSNSSTEPTLSPKKYFVIVTGLLGGGESSSPSNYGSITPQMGGAHFPHVTYEDNIRLQHALCTQKLGVSKLHAYIGFSMGGQQAYHMAILFPDFVQRIVVLAGSARTSWHNWCFLEGPRNALVNSVDFHDGHYTTPVRRGVKAFSRAYSTWALSKEWFWQKCWKVRGYPTLESWLENEWEMNPDQVDANDLLCLLWTWQHGDITLYHDRPAGSSASKSATTGPVGIDQSEVEGDLPGALRRIEAHVLLMPCRTDEYFPPEDNKAELEHLNKGKISVIESIWGHIAGGGGGLQQDNAFIADEIGKFLSDTA